MSLCFVLPDIDECVTNTHNCSTDALCTNIGGGFTCQCNPGFTGDGNSCTGKMNTVS